jgi:hypothetical protein
LKRRYKQQNADILVVSHAKSGRTWLGAMISHVYSLRYGLPEDELVQFDNFYRLDSRIPRILFSHDNRKDERKSPLFTVDDLRGRKVILLVRHPCAVAVSAYFQSFRNARKGLEPRHGGGPIFDYVVDFKLPLVLAFMCRWQDQITQLEQALVVRYEDLSARPEHELARVFSFIEGWANDEEIKTAVAFASFEQMKQREATNFFNSDKLRAADPADLRSYKVREGKVAGYRDNFTDHQLRRIDAMVAAADLGAFGYTAGTVGSEISGSGRPARRRSASPRDVG